MRKVFNLRNFIIGFLFCAVCGWLIGRLPDPPRSSAPRPTRTVDLAADVDPTRAPSPTEAPEPTAIPEEAAPTDVAATPTESGPTATPEPPTVTPVPRTDGAARVIDITDGDTIRVEIDGVIYPVRYIGMDTPERGDPLYIDAMEANRDLVMGKDVWLERDVNETDRFGRLLRYVYIGDVMINEEMVRIGFAQASAYPPDVRFQERLDAAERVARESGAGLWVAAVPTEAPAAPPPAAAPSGGLVIVSVNKGAEYVDIRNDSGAAINLNGWQLLSERGNQTCWLDGTIGAGERWRIWAMSGEGYSCGFGDNIWNNSESDDALLIDPQGQVVFRFNS